ncbi:MAG: ribosome silencing factor [Deltaproteobacteria bacterium]|nr:ribosome silencing factor [Deltaproteobacteria bacterium]
MEGLSTREFADLLARLAIEHKASDLSVLEMSEVIDFADIFVICSADNRRMVRAIAEQISLHVKHELGRLPVGIEGMEASRWVLVDFGDVILHIFDMPLRGFYDLDRLWGDATPLPTPEEPAREEDDWTDEEA